jgi:hypothetical protein
MRPSALFLILCLTGCAARGPIDPVDAPARVLSTGTTYDVTVASDSEPGTSIVGAPLEVVWRALPGALAALDIVAEHRDGTQRVMGNSAMTVRRSLAGEPLSRYLECGSTMSGPIANSYDVRLSLLSDLRAGDGEQTLVRTRLEATARSRDGASASSVPCGTTGRLEARLAELLNRSVGR